MSETDGVRPAAPAAAHVPAGEGPTVWLNGDVYTVKMGAPASGGALSLLEASVPPGGGPPPHDHQYEDEAFYVISGELRICAGDEVFTARAGDFVFIPRGMRHSFRNIGRHTARQLLVFTPGGFEGFFLEAGTPAVPAVPPPPPQTSSDDLVRRIGERYGSNQRPTD